MAKSHSPIRAVVFDLDGTLLRTEHIQWQGWNFALKRYGKRLSLRQYHSYAGHTGKQVEPELISLFELSSLPSASRPKPGALLRAKLKFLHSHLSSKPLHWMPGARTALRMCKRAGLGIGLATSGRRREMMKKLRRLNAHLHFDALVCLDDVKRGKPHPDLYLEACRRLGVPPRAALAFEDTSSGVLSASRAGLKVVAIPTRYSIDQDFSSAWAVCKSFKQAMSLLVKKKLLS